MTDYILTYDIPNEQRIALEKELKDTLNARREFGVSTVWRFRSTYPAVAICNHLRATFPAIKAYVYEVNPANSATTTPSYNMLAKVLRESRPQG